MDPANDQLVSRRGDTIVVMHPRNQMTEEQALIHAAWIVSIVADDERWEQALLAVRST